MKSSLSAMSASIAALTVALAALPSAAGAQNAAPAAPQAAADAPTDTGEIVVTAQRRTEKQLDVPITITTIGQQALQTANVQALPDIVKLTPALRFDNAGGFFQPTIRGVGTPVTTSGGGSNVGIYVDGFYSPNPLAADFQLTKVQSVQVLKGPQGTLFGHNTTGGAILVQTADPSTDPEFEGKVSYGRYNEVRTSGYATFGLTKDIAVDAEGMYSRGDGWQHNISNGQRVGKYENWSGRVGVKADITDDVSVLIRYQHSNQNDPSPLLVSGFRQAGFGTGAPNFAAPTDITYDRNSVATGSAPEDQEFLHVKSDVVQGTIKADLGFADLTSYSQYRKEKVDSNIEVDYYGTQLLELRLPNDNKTWSQEFLLTSKPGTKLQWTAGFFAFSNKDIYTTFLSDAGIVFNPPRRIGGSGTTVKAVAGFVDGTYEITPQIFLTAGARYSHDSVTNAYYNKVDATGVLVFPIPSISSNHVTPRAVLRYKPTDQSSIYASFTKGYKAAIIDAGGSCQNAPFVCNNVAPENIKSYEVGYKYDDRQLSIDVSGFYYDYKNLQVSEFLAGTANIVNAANSRIYGIDAQGNYRFNDRFQVNVGAAWTHARYREFDNAPVYTRCPTVAGCGGGTSFFLPSGITLRNSPMQRAPEFTANVGLKYNTEVADGKLTLTSNLYYSSKLYYGPSGNQFLQKGYALLALRAQWTDPSKHYSIALFGDNVTDTRYKTEVQASNFGIGANWNKPATFGVELGAHF